MLTSLLLLIAVAVVPVTAYTQGETKEHCDLTALETYSAAPDDATARSLHNLLWDPYLRVHHSLPGTPLAEPVYLDSPLGRIKVVRKIGAGGTGRVFLGFLGKKLVAIKEAQWERDSFGRVTSKPCISCLDSEVSVLAAFGQSKDPAARSFPRSTVLGRAGPRQALVKEFIPGATKADLEKLVQSGQISVSEYQLALKKRTLAKMKLRELQERNHLAPEERGIDLIADDMIYYKGEWYLVDP